MSISAPTSTLGPPAPDHAQAIQAEYYNIIDEKGWPVAALIVLVDRKHDPVRAELHLYEELTDDARHWAFRQGRSMVEARYASAEPVPLKIFQSYQGRETVQIRTTGVSRPPAESQDWMQRWQWAAGAGVLILLIALVWAISSFLRSGDEGAPVAEPTAQLEQTAGGETGAEAAASPAPTTASDSALPVSKNADPNLAVGQRVRVRAGLRTALVETPGAEGGIVGYLQDQQEAIIVDGPMQTQGTSDTIVWWRVQLDDGAEAWAPANTSEVAVLELAE
jgi:hypothetical protein